MEEQSKKGLKKLFKPIFLCIGVVLLFCCIYVDKSFHKRFEANAASAPSIVTYQGKLLENGSAATTTQAMYFLLYDSLVGGNVLYSASGTIASPLHVSTTPSNGLFSINLGDTSIPTNELNAGIFQNNTNVYLEVRIGAQTLTPRKQITASPFAFNAKYLDGVAVNTVSSSTYIPMSDVDGTFTFNTTTITTSTVTSATITSSTISTANILSLFGLNEAVLASTTIFGDLFLVTTNKVSMNNVSSTALTADSYVTTTDLTASGVLTVGGSSYFSAMTNGSVFFAGVGGVLSQDSTNLYWDDAQDRLGLGDNTPLYTLTVGSGDLFGVDSTGNIFTSGTLALDNSVLGVVSSTVSDLRLSADGSKNLQFWTNGSERMVIDNSGRIGINSSTPTEQFTMDGGNFLQTATGDPTIKSTFASGDSRAIYISGKYAYVAVGTAGFKIIDISDQAAPTQVGVYNTPANAYGVHVAGKYAYEVDGDAGLLIFDVSNPSLPTLIGSYDTDGSAQGLYVSGKYAYVADSTEGMKVIDVSNPTYPQQVGSLTGIGQALKIYVSGKYAYVNAGAPGMQVIDISNPAAPSLVGNSDSGNALGVYVAGKYAYIADGADGLKVVDISNPNNPTPAGSLDTTLARDVYVAGKYAYIADDLAGLVVVDISNPLLPKLVGSIATTKAYSVKISGKYAYMADGGGGMRIIDINGLETPAIFTGSLQTDTMSITQNVDIGNNLYVRNGINIDGGGLMLDGPFSMSVSSTNSNLYNIFSVTASGTVSIYTPFNILNNGNIGINSSTPSERFTMVGGNFLQTASGDLAIKGVHSTIGAPVDVQVSGKYAYVADQEGLAIFDITNPDDPFQISVYQTSCNSFAVQVSGKYAYVADGGCGLEVFDVSNPHDPVLTGKMSVVVGTASDVYVSGRYAYVAVGGEGLRIVDIADPNQPVQVGVFNTPGDATAVYVNGRYAYVADGSFGLQVIDVSVPSDPSLASTIDTDGNTKDVYVSGRYVYVADMNGGLKVVDAYVPSAPMIVGSLAMSDSARGIYVSGKYAYVAALSAGLQVIDISSSSVPVFVGEVSTSNAVGVYVSGKYVYLADSVDGLNIIDINGMETPALYAGNIATNDLTVTENVDIGNNLYIKNGANIGTGGLLMNGAFALSVSSTDNGFYNLFNVTASSTATKLSAFNILSNGNIGINSSTPSEKLTLVGGNFLQTASGEPALKGAVDTSGNAIDVYVSGKYAYVADNSGGLQIVDITNVNDPTIIANIASNGSVNGVFVSGKYAYIAEVENAAGRLVVADVSNPYNPTVLSYTATGPYASKVYVSGRYAYVGAGAGLKILDISNPAQPVEVEGYTSAGFVYGVYVSGKYAYLADGASGLVIADISDPAGPSFVGGYDTAGTAQEVYVSGKYAFVADGASVLQIINVSDPSNPTLVGSYPVAGAALDVFVSGKYAYVANGNSGMQVVDVSVPSTPTLVGTFSSSAANGVYVSGKYAYVADGADGLRVVDINGTETPTLHAGNVSTNVLSVTENIDIGNNLYVKNGANIGSGGLFMDGPFGMFVSSTNFDLYNIFSITVSTTGRVFPALNIMKHGNVGIGTSSPYAELSVMSNATALEDVFVIATGTEGLIFKVDSYGSTYADGAYTSPAADYAEYYYTNDIDLVSGEVVCLDPSIEKSIKRCSEEGERNVVGVISTNPSVIGNARLGYNLNPHYKIVGMLGQVPTKVSTANGPISIGDNLTASNIPGVAVKAVGDAPIIGTSLENFLDGSGVISVSVNLGWNNTLYKYLNVSSDGQKVVLGSDETPYGFGLYGTFSMLGLENKINFSTTSFFTSAANGSEAFIFDALNYDINSKNHILSLRSNNSSVFSVLANGDVKTIGDVYAKSVIAGVPGQPGDLAEKVDVAGEESVEPGDVLVVDEESPDAYRKSRETYEQAVAGVVSTAPTIIVGDSKTEYSANMAMVGRVPIKVTTENGPIMRGDLLVTASESGFAMKYDPAKDGGTKIVGVIGVALDALTEGQGKVMALIRTGWVYNKNETIAGINKDLQALASAQGINLNDPSSPNNLNVVGNGGLLVYDDGNLDMQGSSLLNISSISGNDQKWMIDAEGRFITKIETSEGQKEMYAMQSPNSEFVFSSSSQLVAGEVKVIFDQATKDIIDFSKALKINVTLTSGEANGIYVSSKDGEGFTVKELREGTSNATFDWIVVAQKKNDDDASEPVEEQLTNDPSDNLPTEQPEENTPEEPTELIAEPTTNPTEETLVPPSTPATEASESSGEIEPPAPPTENP